MIATFRKSSRTPAFNAVLTLQTLQEFRVHDINLGGHIALNEYEHVIQSDKNAK